MKAQELLREMLHLNQVPDYWKEAAEKAVEETAIESVFIKSLSAEQQQELRDGLQNAVRESPGRIVAMVEDHDLERASAIVQAEFCYWRAGCPDDGDVPRDDPTLDLIVTGAVGACANILTALHGMLAPWHPGYTEQQEGRLSDADFEESPEDET